MESRAQSSGGAAGAVAYNVCSTAPAETLNRVLECSQSVALQGLASTGNESMILSAESSGGAAGVFAAVNIYDPSSQNRSGSYGTGGLKSSMYLNIAPRPRRELIMRLDQCKELIEALTSEEGGIIGISSDAALHGFGGFGKTSIAQLVCHMPETTSYFKGGILWMVMGETAPSVAQTLCDITKVVGAEQFNFTNLHFLSAHARASLEERSKKHGPLLAVFDDVWQWDDLEPYLDPFYCCTRLITTRSIVVARRLDKIVQVDAMTSAESCQLLTQGFDTAKLLPATCDSLVKLSDRLFHWPLLLSMSNRLIQRKCKLLQSCSIGEAIDNIHQEMDNGMCALDFGERPTRETTVAHCIAASTDQLTSDEERYFSMLAVFPEDTDVPVTILSTIWGLSDKKAQLLVEKLMETGLVQSCEMSIWSKRCVRLHDVIRSYLLGRRGQNLRQLHKRLLGAYRPDSAHWWKMEEQYMYQHLEYHMNQAGCYGEYEILSNDIRWYLAKCASLGFLDLADRIMSHSLAHSLYEKDRNALLQLVHQTLLSKMWTESAIDLLLENTVRFLITDNHSKEFTDFDFINKVGLTASYERLIEKYGQQIPYLVDCDQTETLTEEVVVRLLGICFSEKMPSVAREQVISSVTRGLRLCDYYEKENNLKLLINWYLDHWSNHLAQHRMVTILSASESPNDVFTLLVGILTDGWQEGRYQAFVVIFKKLYNSTHFETAVAYLPKLQMSFSEPYSNAIIQCLLNTIGNNPQFDATHAGPCS